MIKSFVSIPDRNFHFNCSASHRARTIVLLRSADVPQKLVKEIPDQSMVSILSEYRHLPLLGLHVCTTCGLTVAIESRTSLEAVASELNGHLKSKEHKYTKRVSTPMLEDIGELPSRSLAIDHDKFACYRCESFPEFSSFLSLCLHVNTIHKPNVVPTLPTITSKPEKPWPHDDYILVNEDGLSRTCSLCNVVVWSEDDPHLLGKRHAKALWYHQHPEAMDHT